MALLGAFNFSIKLIETAKPVSAMVGACLLYTSRCV